MNIFKDSKKQKKFIIALVMLILFNFCYPKNVNAFSMQDIVAAPAKIFWMIEKGILKFLNNIFTSDDYDADISYSTDENDYQTTNFRFFLTPDNIIKGRFLLLDANIFKNIKNVAADYYYDLKFDASGNPTGAIAEGRITLRETISGWYYALRNFAIVALLSVLVYVGIRMIMTSVAQDKAKYKVMFKDWLVALCLLIVMHYLMIGILNITSLITEAIGGGENANLIGNLVRDITGALCKKASENDYTYTNPEGDEIDLAAAYSKIIVLAGIILYSFIFAIKYLKREFTVIFLILLGPVSCITYPIDKISDGKAQAFNKWFSEFLYQVIIQPFHLLLYIVLIGSAAQLANANVIYALVCFAILIPAEKFIKEMFGIKDTLGSPLGAMAAGAMASKALSALKSKDGKSSAGGGKSKEEGNDSKSSLPPKTVDTPELDKGSEGENGNNEQVDQQDNPELESGEGSEEGNAVQVDQQDNPELESGEGAEGEDKIDQKDNPELDSGGGNSKGEENKQLGEGEKKPTTLDKLKAVHNQRMAKKWGSTNKGQRWKNRTKKAGRGLGKLVGGTAKFAGRAIGVAAGATIGGTLGIMTGKGAAGFAAGAAIGGGLANKTIKGVSGSVKGVTKAIGSAGRDYRGAFRSDEKAEKRALKDFKSDPKEMEKALASYKKNHPGQEPSYKQLEQEMEDRFALSRYGLKEEQIDKSVKYYQQERAKNPQASEKALTDTVFAAKLAEQYDKKDFSNEQMMKDAVTALSKKFSDQNVSSSAAEANARKYLEQAAKIKGAKNTIL